MAKMFRDDANVLEVLDVLVDSGVERHVLGANGKPFLVLRIIVYVNDQRDACRVPLHEVSHEVRSQVHTLKQERKGERDDMI